MRMMPKRAPRGRWGAAAALLCVSVAGCAELPASGAPSSTTGTNAPSSTAGSAGTLAVAEASPDVRQALETLQQLQEENKELRSLVEVQSFELEKLRRRQRELYDDLDQRLRRQERLTSYTPIPAPGSRAPGAPGIGYQPAPSATGGLYPPVGSAGGAYAPGATPAPGVVPSEPGGIQAPGYVAPGYVETAPGVPQPTTPAPGQVQETIPTQATTASVVPYGSTGGQAPLTPPPAPAPASPGVATTGVEVPSPSISGQVAQQPIEGSGVAVPTAPATTASTGLGGPVSPGVPPAGPVSEPPVSVFEQQVYDEAFALLKQSRYSDAALAFENFLRQFPNSGLADDAYYWMAEARYVTREFEAALASFRTVVTYFPTSSRVPASYLKIGYIQYEMGAVQEAQQTLTEVVKAFPAHRVAVSAEARLQKIARETN